MCIFLLQFSTNLSWALLDVPYVRLFERAICQKHYASAIDEAECKIPPVQRHLAKVLGLKVAFDVLPGE
jgi:hypothetical protein